MKKILITMMFVLLFVVGSCGGDDSSSKGGVGESCTKTADCKDGLKCIDQVCVSDTGDTGNTGDTCTGSDKFCHSHAGLDWSDKASDKMNWDDAMDYCKNLGGRLPTISELRTLIQNCPDTETGGSCGVTDSCLEYSCRDSSCAGCYYDSSGKYSVFGDTGGFWSSSSDVDNAYRAWYVYFLSGRVNRYVKINGSNARCVR